MDELDRVSGGNITVVAERITWESKFRSADTASACG
jgi:hypothetical protein